MNSKSLSRRQFIQQAGIGAGVTAVSTRSSIGASIQGANDRIGVGFIGFGIRGPFLLRAVEPIPDAEIRSCCDLYDGHFEGIKELGHPNVSTTRRYEDVLADKDIDVVIVATPDHWHKKIVLDSLSAGKDVYIEKPMTHRWQDAAEFVDAVKRTGRILQVGSQQASNPANEQAIEMIRSGKLGNITYLSAAILRNTPTGAWYYPIPPDANEETVDWKRFIGDTPWHDFDLDRFFQWRLYWEYSGGLPTDLFVHMITLTHTLMDVRVPKRVISMGGIYNWKDRREVPDHLSALVEYDKGFVLALNSSANTAHRVPFLTIMGTEGAIEFQENGTGFTYYSEPIRDSYWYSTLGWPKETRLAYYEAHDIDPATNRPRNAPSGAKPETIKVEGDNLGAHMKNFFNYVREHKQPFEDALFGGQCATVGHMTNISYREGKPVIWDKDQDKVVVV
jgi:predicted dehydrogenase